jgi:hypothetical protein
LITPEHGRYLATANEDQWAMKSFIAACIAAAVIATGAMVVLNDIQEPVETAYSTSGARI